MQDTPEIRRAAWLSVARSQLETLLAMQAGLSPIDPQQLEISRRLASWRITVKALENAK